MNFSVRLRGRGRAEVTAYGVADAEHQVEAQLARCWPAAELRVTQVRRTHEEPRIAEEFFVDYLLYAAVEVEAPDAAAARRESFQQARRKLEGSRFWMVSWDDARVREEMG